MGGYTPGQDPDLDLAVGIWPQLMELIQQNGMKSPSLGQPQCPRLVDGGLIMGGGKSLFHRFALKPRSRSCARPRR